MDLDLSEDETRFQLDVRAWLRANVPSTPVPSFYTSEGFRAHREFEGRLYDAGYAALHWPQEYGGAGASLMVQTLFQEEYIAAMAPTRLNRLGLGLIGPTLIARGTKEQKDRFVARILTCDDIWAQGFSEPGAGSDLAAIQTTGRRDGDELVINGQKTWTSLASFATWMFALVRTGSDTPKKHHGLTFVLIPLSAPGVTVREMRQLHGEPGFAEVFLDEVRVPLTDVVGEIGQGWAMAMLTLSFERGTGLGNHARYLRDLEDLAKLATVQGRAEDVSVRRRLAELASEAHGFRSYMRSVLSRIDNGDTTVVPSVSKLTWSNLETRIFAMALDLLGQEAQLSDGAGVSRLHVHHRYWHARASSIFAGATEIQRNIIAERTLGLPRVSA